MAFPETRLTLIHRIAAGDDKAAWNQFLADYWRPICLFAMRIGGLRWEDAEDIGSQSLEVFSQKDLLQRWLQSRDARFKTLVCGVVRNLISNWQRSDQARARHWSEYAANWVESPHTSTHAEDVPAFYAIWADEQLRSAVEAIMWSYHHEGNGDYFRVLHSRLCDQMTVSEIAEALQIKVTDADNYFRHARQRLTQQLQSRVRHEVERYTFSQDLATEFQREWAQLSAYFESRGGLEEAIRRAAAVQSTAAISETR